MLVTPHFQIGLRNRTANMAPPAVHLPIHIPWVRKNCRRNRGKAEFRENTVSLTVLAYGTFTPNFPWFLSHPCICFGREIYINVSAHLSVCPTVHTAIHLSDGLFVCLSFGPSVCHLISPFVCPSIHLNHASFRNSKNACFQMHPRISTRRSVCPSVGPSVR